MRGLYLSTSALLSFRSYQESVATSLANVDTPGYKSYRPAVGSFAQQLLQINGRDGQAVIGSVGLDTALVGGKTDNNQGALQETARELDMAIAGSGFFTVATEAGVRYTRAGRFDRDDRGRLVTAEGNLVLSDRGVSLTLGSGPVQVETDGRIIDADGQELARLGLVAFPNPDFLTREDFGLFSPSGSSGEPASVGTQVRQGFLEGANVDVGQAMVSLMATFRAYEANQRALEAQDNTLRLAVSELARF